MNMFQSQNLKKMVALWTSLLSATQTLAGPGTIVIPLVIHYLDHCEHETYTLIILYLVY